MNTSLLILGVIVGVLWTTTGFTVKRTGDNSNWCCEVKPTVSSSNFTSIEIHQFTKVIWEEKEGPIHQCEPGENTTVGLFGWDCQGTVNVSRTVITYQQVPVVKPVLNQGVCPTEHLVCCEGYVKHQDQCLKSSVVNSLQALIDAGLIG